MRFVVFVCAVMQVALCSPVEAMNLTWTLGVPSPTPGDSKGYRISLSLADDSYVVGSDGTLGTVSEDIFLAKLNSSGSIMWSTVVTDTVGTFDRAVGVDVDGNGNVYVGGSVNNGWLVAKYDSAGNTLWRRAVRTAGAGQERAYAIDVTSDGHAIIVGFLLPGGIFTNTMVKFDAVGNVLWTAALPAAAATVLVEDDGTIFLSGSKAVSSQTDLWVAKYTAAGGLIWEYTYDAGSGGPIPDDRASGLARRGDNLVVVGSSWRDAGGTITRGDFTTVVLDTAGTEQWVRHYAPSTFNDEPRGFALSPQTGNIYVMGYYFGSSLNTTIVAYDSTGTELWNNHVVGQNDPESGRCVAVGDDESVYVTVRRQAGSVGTLAVVRYAPDGSQISELEYDVPGVEQPGDMQFGSSGDLFVVGSEGYVPGNGTQQMVVLRVEVFNVSTGVPIAPARKNVEFHQPFPNPFNPNVTIGFSLPSSGRAKLEIFDAAGRRVSVLANREFASGPHVVRWEGRGKFGRVVPSGVYFARLEVAGAVQTRRLVLLK